MGAVHHSGKIPLDFAKQPDFLLPDLRPPIRAGSAAVRMGRRGTEIAVVLRTGLRRRPAGSPAGEDAPVGGDHGRRLLLWFFNRRDGRDFVLGRISLARAYLKYFNPHELIPEAMSPTPLEP